MTGETPGTGVVGEFRSAGEMVSALRALREGGYRSLDSFSPHPVREVEEVLAPPRPTFPRWVLAAGVAGAAIAYCVQWYANAWDYPLNVGGRPLYALPVWIPSMLAVGIAFAIAAAFAGLCRGAGLPALWHPAFEVEGFESASADRYWVVVGSDDSRYHPLHTAEALRREGALRVVPIRRDG